MRNRLLYRGCLRENSPTPKYPLHGTIPYMNPMAFSTLACPEWDVTQIIAGAVAYGFGAVELRGYQAHLDLTEAAPFSPVERTQTRAWFADAGVAVCCVSTSGVVAEGNLPHVRAHAELAHDLGAPFVRVFGGSLPADISHTDGVTRFAETLRGFGDAAQEAGVAIVLETHDSFSTGASVAELLAATCHPAVFSLWDVHHPFRQGGSIETTHQLLAPTLRHVHLKDGKDGVYTLLGDGDIPLRPALDLLLAGGYTGALSLEWERRWHPNLAPPEIALPQCARFLSGILQQ